MKKQAAKFYLGAHMSIAGGVYKAFARGEDSGCDTMQIFVKSSNQWRAKPLTDEDINLFQSEQQRTGITPVIAHDSYLINLGSPDPDMLEKSRRAFSVEMERCERLGIPNLVAHPGSHLNSGERTGIRKITDSLNKH